MDQQTINQVLASEFGYLDAKYGMGYHPRPSGYQKEYDAGRREWREYIPPHDEIASYKENMNHGWN